MEVKFNLDVFMKYLTDKGGEVALATLKTTLEEAAASGSDFLVKQAQLTIKYLKMRDAKEITPEECKSLFEDLEAALKSEVLRMNLSARQAGQKLLLAFTEILKGALSVLITVVL
jgi:hypothetical protein